MKPELKAHQDSTLIKPFHPSSFFYERVINYWISLWKCWRVVIDWTVWLYVFIPGVWIFSGIYRDFINHPPPWLYDVPVILVLTLLSMVQLAGSYRTFAESGDGLFLRRKRSWIKKFTVLGYGYSFIVRIGVAILTLVLLAPLLLTIYAYEYHQLAELMILTSLLGFVLLLLKDRISQRWSGWRHKIVLLVIKAISLVSYVSLISEFQDHSMRLGLMGIALFLIAIWQMSIRLRMRGTWLHELNVENKAYMASVGWIVKESLDKRPVPLLKKPLMFRRSQPLFKNRDAAAILLESGLKASLRRPDLVKPCLYFLFVGAAAVSLPPLLLGFLVWLVLPMLVQGWLLNMWRQWLSDSFVSLFPWREEILEQAEKKLIIVGSLPFIILWSFLLGVRAGLAYGAIGWLAIAFLPVLGYFWLRWIGEILTSFRVRRSKE